MRALLVIPLAVLVGCTQTDSIKVSENQAIISTSAAPICGGAGAGRVAQKMAAIETIRAGYDRYVVVGANRDDTTRLVQMPGQYRTTGSFTGYGGFSANTVYSPGPTFVAGRHSQQLAIRMFRDGEPGADQAISARSVLGPKWESLVKTGISTCGDM